jgi:hypothetical protein
MKALTVKATTMKAATLKAAGMAWAVNVVETPMSRP